MNLDDPVENFLPEFASGNVLKNDAGTIDDTEPAERSVSRRHLLTQISGFSYDFLNPGSFIADACDNSNVRDTDGTLPDMVKLLNALNVGADQLFGLDTLELVYENALPEGLWLQFLRHGELFGKGHSAACTVNVAAFPNEHPDTAGACWWGGVAGPQWWLSPKHGFSVAIVTQKANAFAHPFATEFKNLVEDALEAWRPTLLAAAMV